MITDKGVKPAIMNTYQEKMHYAQLDRFQQGNQSEREALAYHSKMAMNTFTTTGMNSASKKVSKRAKSP